MLWLSKNNAIHPVWVYTCCIKSIVVLVLNKAKPLSPSPELWLLASAVVSLLTQQTLHMNTSLHGAATCTPCHRTPCKLECLQEFLQTRLMFLNNHNTLWVVTPVALWLVSQSSNLGHAINCMLSGIVHVYQWTNYDELVRLCTWQCSFGSLIL